VSHSLGHNAMIWRGLTLFTMHAMFVQSDCCAENRNIMRSSARYAGKSI
jgi:hypothetical protein